MATAAQTGLRLVIALESLADEEAIALASSDFERLAEIQDRAAPLVIRLTSLAFELPAGIRTRAQALAEKRSRHLATLTLRMEENRGDFDRIQQSRHTVARVAPVYGRLFTATPSQFAAAG